MQRDSHVSRKTDRNIARHSIVKREVVVLGIFGGVAKMKSRTTSQPCLLLLAHAPLVWMSLCHSCARLLEEFYVRNHGFCLIQLRITGHHVRRQIVDLSTKLCFPTSIYRAARSLFQNMVKYQSFDGISTTFLCCRSPVASTLLKTIKTHNADHRWQVPFGLSFTHRP